MRSGPTYTRCPACRFRNRASARFCGGCGARLPGGAEAAEPAGERRQLTLMFCDLVDSTRLAVDRDPEDLRTILLGYREACTEAIEGWGGTVAQYVGDGLLAYFGFPRANEDDPERAIRAGLAILAAMRTLNARLSSEGLGPLRVRVGLHTGLVVIADLGRGAHVEARAVVGDTTNIAARLQQASPPDQVVVSEATRRLAEGHFQFQDIGQHHLKGLPDPVRAHRVVGEFAARSRFEARGAGTPFVDRAEELQRLLDLWRATQAGAGRAIVIEGEPGIGKSRLLHEFRSRIGEAAHIGMVLDCNEHDRTSTFQPVINWLRTVLGPQDDADAGALRRRLEAPPERFGPIPAEHLPALAALLGCATAAEESDLAAAARRRRRRTIEALVAVVLAMGRAGPELLVLEDVQWADDSTLSFLRALADRIAEAPLMLLVTSRPGAMLPVRLEQERLVLERLVPGDARQLAQGMAEGRVTAALLDRIVARTDGIPLFVEEITRTAIGHDSRGGGAAGGNVADIPMTLRDSLMAQLDLLPEAKPVAQLASVLGRSFRTEVIEAVAVDRGGMQGAALHRSLRALTEARFLEPAGDALDGYRLDGYRFRHGLIQETAYESLLRGRRQTYHLWAAETLRERFPDTGAAQPEVLAQHLAAAGRHAEAVLAWQTAAERAGRLSANVEAAEHCRKALALVPRLPETPERTELEVRLNVTLAAQVTITRGNAEPEVLLAFERAHAAAERLGDRRLLMRTLRGMLPFHLVRGDIGAGHRIGLRLMELVAEESDPGLLIQAWRPFGLCLLYLGRFGEAKHRLNEVLRLYDEERHAAQRFEYGSDPAVLAHCHLAWVEWFMGRRERAAEHIAAALAGARHLNHPHSLAFALAFQACLEQFEDRPDGARAAAEELIRIARPLDYAYWVAWGEILRGWAMARTGKIEAGEQQLRRGLEDYAATGAGLLRPYALHLLAEVICNGRRDEALGLLDEALRQSGTNHINLWRAETLRLKARLLASEWPNLAAQCARESLKMAHRQGAEQLAGRAAATLRALGMAEEDMQASSPYARADDAAASDAGQELQERRHAGHPTGSGEVMWWTASSPEKKPG